jgi:hypothetical protein
VHKREWGGQSGYLEKHSTGLIKKWIKRYFVISTHYLKYFEVRVVVCCFSRIVLNLALLLFKDKDAAEDVDTDEAALKGVVDLKTVSAILEEGDTIIQLQVDRKTSMKVSYLVICLLFAWVLNVF